MNLHRLKELRHSCRYTQQDLADELMLTRSAYSSYETGANDPPVDSLVRIADFYNVSVDYLLGRSDIPQPDINLSKEELILLEHFSRLNAVNRHSLLKILHSFLTTQQHLAVKMLERKLR